MRRDSSQPAVQAVAVPGGWTGHFRKPGGSWQVVADAAGARVLHATEAGALRAATDLVFRFMCPPITAEASKVTQEADSVFSGLKGPRVKRDTIRRLGKPAVAVERKRRRA